MLILQYKMWNENLAMQIIHCQFCDVKLYNKIVQCKFWNIQIQNKKFCSLDDYQSQHPRIFPVLTNLSLKSNIFFSLDLTKKNQNKSNLTKLYLRHFPYLSCLVIETQKYSVSLIPDRRPLRAIQNHWNTSKPNEIHLDQLKPVLTDLMKPFQTHINQSRLSATCPVHTR